MTRPGRREALGSYLRGRIALGEPEMFLPVPGRGPVLERVRGGLRVRRANEDDGGPASELARSGTREQILAIRDFDVLREVAEGCTRCPLHASRTRVVFADGDPAARVLCVGEAPGANEDRTGLPFVGRAGQLLDRLLLSVGFPRAEVFICNVLKCRPPGNRNPLPEEIERCSPFLLRQVEMVDPAVIIAFGTFAAQTLLGSRDSLRRMRGRTYRYRGYPLVVTYHPAALLRNPGWTRPTWRDLQLARRIVDGEEGARTVLTAGDREAVPATGERSGPARETDQLTLGGGDG